jgi:hypothetical protein
MMLWRKQMTRDEVCASYAERNVKITCRLLDDDLILIEGDRDGLEFLGNLFLAQANDACNCHDSLQPNGAGSAFFTAASNRGIYIHRLPCEHGNNSGA